MKDKGYVQVGLIGVGLSTYWSQFEGLLPRLLEYQSYINNRMKGAHANVIDAGMVDSPEKAAQAATLLKKKMWNYYSFSSPHTHFLLPYFLSHNVVKFLSFY